MPSRHVSRLRAETSIRTRLSSEALRRAGPEAVKLFSKEWVKAAWPPTNYENC